MISKAPNTQTYAALFTSAQQSGLFGSFFKGGSRGADWGPFEAVEGCVDPEVQSGLHGVVLVVRPDGGHGGSVRVVIVLCLNQFFYVSYQHYIANIPEGGARGHQLQRNTRETQHKAR